MRKAVTLIIPLVYSLFGGLETAYGAFENYSNVLIGEKAAGMGGAFTAVEGDPGACSYYNPATLARLRGHSLSAAATVYHKYDTKVGRNDSGEAALRVNQGSFKPIPSLSGSVGAFGNFALGLSIVMPQHDYYSGEIDNQASGTTQKNTIMQLSDEVLWVGGNIAMNITETQSVGFTAYYTSRDYQRTIIDQARSGGTLRLVTESKTFTNNSLIYSFGYYEKYDANWAFGSSVRFPSMAIAGRGSFFRSDLDTAVSPDATTTAADDIQSFTKVPLKIAMGVSHTIPQKRTYSMDVTWHDTDTYDDFAVAKVAERREHRPIFNYHLGGEFFIKPWARLRLGVYTNLAATAGIPEQINGVRYSDHIDMMGFSANMAIYNSDSVGFTFGGYYTGGSGESTQVIGQQVVRKQKSKQIFSMLVASSYYF